MKRTALFLAALLACGAAAGQETKRVNVETRRVDGSSSTFSFATATPPSSATLGCVGVFLGSPLNLQCDAGLSYDAVADTLTVGRYNIGGAVATGVVLSAIANKGFLAAAGDGSAYSGFLGDFVHLSNYGGILFSSTASPAAASDLGLARASAGVLKVTDGSTGAGSIQAGGLQFLTGSRPTCDAAARGKTWYVAGGAGAADTCEICRKDASDNYAWVTIF